MNYIKITSIATLSQVFIFLGPLLILAVIMQVVAGTVEKLSYRLFGTTLYLVLFGWLGTIIHELGHAIFCILFGHKITDMKLFKPDPETGTLGYVNHSYNPRNIYHTIGNFFIGIGPILLGSISLFILVYYLLGVNLLDVVSYPMISSQDFASMGAITALGKTIFTSTLDIARFVFIGNESALWKLAILVYVLYSIGSSITLSLPDTKGALSGFISLVLILFAFNLATYWYDDMLTSTIVTLSSYFSSFYMLISMAIIVVAVFGVVIVLSNVIKSIIQGISNR